MSSQTPCPTSFNLTMSLLYLKGSSRCLCHQHGFMGIEDKVKKSHSEFPAPSFCPPNRLFVPVNLCSQVIQSMSSSCLACHPGMTHTLALGADCCQTQNKNPCHDPAILLHPLPVLHRLWPHISLSQTASILTAVDQFSKSVHLIPLPKLPSAKKTAEFMLQSLFQFVFRLYGLPRDIVSDWVPQFTFRFWNEF